MWFSPLPLFLKLYFSSSFTHFCKNTNCSPAAALILNNNIPLLFQYTKDSKGFFLPEPVGPKSRMLLLSNWIFSTSESSMSLPACSRNCVGEWTPLAPKGELRFDVCVISICNSTRQQSKVLLTCTGNSFYIGRVQSDNKNMSTTWCSGLVSFHMHAFFSFWCVSSSVAEGFKVISYECTSCRESQFLGLANYWEQY